MKIRSKFSTLPIHNTHLRTLFLRGNERPSKRGEKVNHHISLDLALICDKFKLLRVLDINGIKVFDGVMPKEIGNLIHLRYLRIISTNISELPQSIGKLRKLLTLDYWNVSVDNNGIKLPNVLWKLKHLRHLYLPYEMNSIKDNFKLESLKNLQTLWGVKGGDWMIDEMSKLSSKLRKLCIQGISTPKLIDLVFKCTAIDVDSLYSLALDWYGFELKGLEALCSKLSLKKLSLTGKVLDDSKPIKFPTNLEKVELYYTHLKKQDSLAALGNLKCLKFLRLGKDSYMGKEWIGINATTFTRLEELKLSHLPNLEKWEMEKGAMPYLKKLSIVYCINLTRIPEGLKSISSLERLSIERMPRSFSSKIRKASSSKGEGEDFNIIQHIPKVEIQDCSASFNY